MKTHFAKVRVEYSYQSGLTHRIINCRLPKGDQTLSLSFTYTQTHTHTAADIIYIYNM